MNEPLTEELLDELLDAPNPATFASKHDIGSLSLSDYLQRLLDEKQLKRPDVIRDAGLNSTFGYQIFTGARKPSRDKLLQIAFAMKLDLKETDRLLQAGGWRALYCKDRRDAIIIFCISHHADLRKTDEQLYHFGEETICQKD